MVIKNSYYLALIVIAALLVSLVQVIFKSLALLYNKNIFMSLLDIKLYVAFSVYVVAFVMWMFGLSKIELSVAIPMNVLSVIMAGILGAVFFNEAITPLKITAYFVIVIGVLLLAISSS